MLGKKTASHSEMAFRTARTLILAAGTLGNDTNEDYEAFCLALERRVDGDGPTTANFRILTICGLDPVV